MGLGLGRLASAPPRRGIPAIGGAAAKASAHGR
jgi:hypothetical protein